MHSYAHSKAAKSSIFEFAREIKHLYIFLTRLLKPLE